MGKHNHLIMPENHMEEFYSSKNPLIRKIYRDRLYNIADIIPKKRIKILDAGCGEGHMLAVLHNKDSNYQLYGTDVVDCALKSAKIRCPYARLTKQDLTEKLSFKNEFFDVIICTEVLEHIFDYKKAIFEMKRVLKKGGLLIITFPNDFTFSIGRLMLLKWPPRTPDHVNSFTPEKMAKHVGLDVCYRRNMPFNIFFSLSLKGMLVFKK